MRLEITVSYLFCVTWLPNRFRAGGGGDAVCDTHDFLDDSLVLSSQPPPPPFLNKFPLSKSIYSHFASFGL